MEKIDIDRLHRVNNSDNLYRGRGHGKTFAMIVNALQNTELVNDPILILSHSMKGASLFCNKASKIATLLGYEFKRKKYSMVVNGVEILFKSAASLSTERGIEFTDHYAQEVKLMEDIEEKLSNKYGLSKKSWINREIDYITPL